MNIAQKTKGIVFKNYSFDEGYIVNELKKLMQQYESTEAFVDYFYKLDGDDWIADSYIGEKSSLLNREPYYWVCGLDICVVPAPLCVFTLSHMYTHYTNG